ncbi:hypothetical protein BOTBODRAFT_62968 [Botryobasidium botryosum FD-172 SS1]|uniref:F-box domain-containing protein n=1 Tax=Botryobasidium botryosum (strain FD-172 SS1) TaxID=930990 RepID=A0A067MY99_BOTB1|nr:hypothetical protein BOTBODRAFT_62968 [Botryobasidium botryosum FD-172 SS1]
MSRSDALAEPPIQRLTDDALLDIFAELSVERDEDSIRVDVKSVVCLAGVCHKWRELVHGYSLLWSYIELDLETQRDVDLRATYWLDRARGRLLTIHIQLDPSRPPENTSDKQIELVRLARALQDSMDRWVSLTLYGHAFYIDIFLWHCSEAMPMLKWLDIDPEFRRSWEGFGDNNKAEVPIFIPFTSASDHHLCHDIRVDFSGVPKFTPSFGIAIADLTLRLDRAFNFPVDGILNALRSCPNLINLCLVCRSDIGSPRSTGPIPLPKLVDLYLQCSYETIPTYVTLLQFSALKLLSIPHIRWSPIVSSGLMRIFQACPFLTSIKLGHSASSGSAQAPNDLPLPTIPLITLPFVTEFHVHGDPCFFPYQRRLALPNVEELRLEVIPFDVALRFVSNTSRLRTLILLKVEEQPHTYTARHSFPALTSLNTSLFSGALDTIHAPKLVFLTIVGSISNSALSPAPVRRLVDRSAPPLISLDLQNVEIPDDDLLWCFERLSRLQSLALHACSTSDIVLHALAIPLPDQNTPLLPRLNRIYFVYNDNITAAGVIAFLASRNGPSQSAESPKVEGFIQLSGSAELHEYEEMESYGLSVARDAYPESDSDSDSDSGSDSDLRD